MSWWKRFIVVWAPYTYLLITWRKYPDISKKGLKAFIGYQERKNK